VFAVAWGSEETVDEFLVGVWCGVVEERFDVSGGRRESGEVEGDAADEGFARRFRGEGEALFLECAEEEAVDGVAAAGRRRFGDWWDEGPVAFVGGAFGDPAAEEVGLGRGDRLVEVGGRHEVVLVGGEDPAEDLAVFGFLEVDARVAGFAAFDCGLAEVEAEVGLALLFVGAVAMEAFVREDGPDVAIEAHVVGCGGGERQNEQQGDERTGRHSKRTRKNHGFFI
jgi:hypothetical protein